MIKGMLDGQIENIWRGY